VISSPNHINITVPAVSVIMISTNAQPAEGGQDAGPAEDQGQAPGWSRRWATVNQRVQRVILRRPTRLLAELLHRVETTVISCMMIEALI